MLYKKYHRSYVRKFRRGVKLEGDFEIVDQVFAEPSIMTYGRVVYIGYNNYWVLIESDGKLTKYNVIQEIS